MEIEKDQLEFENLTNIIESDTSISDFDESESNDSIEEDSFDNLTPTSTKRKHEEETIAHKNGIRRKSKIKDVHENFKKFLIEQLDIFPKEDQDNIKFEIIELVHKRVQEFRNLK